MTPLWAPEHVEIRVNGAKVAVYPGQRLFSGPDGSIVVAALPLSMPDRPPGATLTTKVFAPNGAVLEFVGRAG